MNRLTSHSLLRAGTWATIALLSACGGGGGDGGAPPVIPVAQTISFETPGNQSFSNTPINLVATSSSGLVASLATSTPAVCSVSNAVLTMLGVGSCTVSASQAGNVNFLAATPVNHTFTVAPAAQTITFVAPGNQSFGIAPAPLVATSTSGLTVAFASDTPAVCTVSGTALTLLNLGTCTLTASQPGTANYTVAPTVQRTLTVASQMLAQTISFTAPGNQVMGVAPAALVATSSSGLPVTVVSTTPNICTVNGSTLSLVTSGSCSLSAGQPGNLIYAAATAAVQTFTVTAAPQTISFNPPGNQALGTAPAALVASSTSGLAVSLVSTTPTVCTVNGTNLNLFAVGNCTVEANQAGNATYAAALPVARSFQVSGTAQTITFNFPGNQTLGTAPAALVASSSSGLAVSLTSSTPAVCTVSGTTLSLVAAGTCTVTASQAGSGIFAAATVVARSFTVAAAPLTAQTITFNAPANQTIGTATPALVASASSGLTVTLTSTTAAVCTVSGTTLSLVSAGTCTVDATQPGNTTFAAAATVTRSFTVTAAPLAQTITFTAPGMQALGSTPAALVASSTSGLAVAFSSSTTGICTVSGTTLTLVGTGSCTLEASQPGNGTYAAATPVSRSFTVGINAFANSGFEVAANSAGEFADGWMGANSSQATRSAVSPRTGSFSARIAVPDPGLGGSGLFQNSIDHGGLAAVSSVNWGTSPTLTFWIRGNSSETGNLNYALRYLSSNGTILNAGANARTIWTGNSVRGWTQITLAGIVIPVNTTAVFLEMTLAVGPTGVQPPGNCGVDNATGQPLPCNYGQAEVYLDDVSLPLLP